MIAIFLKNNFLIFMDTSKKCILCKRNLFEKCQIKITKNLKSGLNCPVYIFQPADIVVIDKTDSLESFLYYSMQRMFQYNEHCHTMMQCRALVCRKGIESLSQTLIFLIRISEQPNPYFRAT